MKVQIIIGSTRPGRVSDRIGHWVANEVERHAEVEVVDLQDYDLPFLDEAVSPQYNPDRQPNDVAQKFLSKLSEADGYVIVTPEYNRSYSAVLKNALDYVDFQLAKKPIALVAHGSTGGAQAVSHLRGVIPGLQGITVPNATYLVGRAGELIDDQGQLHKDLADNPYGPQAALAATVQDLVWYAQALTPARVEVAQATA